MKNIMNFLSKTYLACSVMLFATLQTASAREVIGTPPKGNGNITSSNSYFQTMAAGCKQPTAQVDLDINNVRTTIMNGGDMWWNLVSAKYEIPKVTDPNGVRKHSIFAGSLWIGGVDAGKNLKLAAMTYRQNGVDFYAGPLDTTTSPNPIIDPQRCDYYDRIYKVTRAEIDSFVLFGNAKLTKAISSWPGNGIGSFGESQYLAPFVDVDNDGLYSPANGDYPDIPGDQALWFVYNDRGNIHTETQGVPIGLELQTTAFAFATNDEINNMTFYTTKVINRGEPVEQVYFGQWIDPDLGNYSDDYVGCDTTRQLGYCYNADDDDEGILGYGKNPPTVGLDFFKGPVGDSGTELGMSYFVYYNNDFTNIGNPFRPSHFYNFLKGLWHDGSPMTYGGNGTGGSTVTHYMFPGDPVTNSGWTEKTAGNQKGDRRFIQSSGPFTLKTGAVNEVTVGAVWARSSAGGATGSLNLLRLADDKAQTLFNNKFKIFDGPSAPDLALKELNNEIVITLENTNEIEKYDQKLKNPLAGIQPDSFNYKFQGYMIYQLKDGGVSNGELDNTERARLVAQYDLKDNTIQLVNKAYDPIVNQYVPVSKVIGGNEGIKHTLTLKEDLFASGDKKLINYKTYYYLIISYANIVNDLSSISPDQFLAGRKNVRTYSAIPHNSKMNLGGTEINSSYGSGPKITQLSGMGNGGNDLELSQVSIDKLMGKVGEKSGINKLDAVEYDNGHGPINIKVVDPMKVGNYEFELFIEEDPKDTSKNRDFIKSTSSAWRLINKTTGETLNSDAFINKTNEQLISKWGISITINQVNTPATNTDEFDKTNGVLKSSITYKDNTKQWLTGIPDIDGTPYYNWIRSGNAGKQEQFGSRTNDAYLYNYDYARNTPTGLESWDPFENYEKICNKLWGPYKLVSRAPRKYTASGGTGSVTYGPGWGGFYGGTPPLQAINGNNENRIEELASVNIVLTSDKSKWTRCVVLEMCEDSMLSEGNRNKFFIRKHASWTGEFDANGRPIYDATDEGRSWFPGYAINVETGERLNIMFGEDSWLKSENGNDMLWNPTSLVEDGRGPLFGGKHHIYVCGSTTIPSTGSGNAVVTYAGTIYDEGAAYKTVLDAVAKNPSSPNALSEMTKVTSQIQWVMMPFLQEGFKLDPKTIVPQGADITFKIRMTKPYARFNYLRQNIGYPHYTFKTEELQRVASEDAGKKGLLELTNIVPNPYYASSGYESNQLDTRVKLINLPPKCTITIYSLNGNLIRRIKKDDPATYIDWDLKNSAQVPIASGVYLIHIDAGALGERTLKWVGVMRPIDLDTF
ncbi:MAG: hypothetical protein HYZ42_18400 [Bacteroidetes bacterium]|nr:hypothetical protein [Bacteroidota bacterium]